MEITMFGTPIDIGMLTGVRQIDPAYSEVSFTVRHLMVRVRGGFTRFSGTITVGNKPAHSGVRARVDTASVDTRNAARDEQVRAVGFLDTENHPTASFESARVRRKDGGYVVEGQLTIRGEMRTAAFDLFPLGVDTDASGWARGIPSLLPYQPFPVRCDGRCASARRTCADRRHRHAGSGDPGGQGALTLLRKGRAWKDP
ncbi:YceI family protein [Streptomyces sp. NPDC020800]|uniref:YceI family protein n=1 Tax=Streptomyces sp. NPDC020800 TaxID=3365092 RepID=UPI00378853C2